MGIPEPHRRPDDLEFRAVKLKSTCCSATVCETPLRKGALAWRVCHAIGCARYQALRFESVDRIADRYRADMHAKRQFGLGQAALDEQLS